MVERDAELVDATWARVVSWLWPCGCWRVTIWTDPVVLDGDVRDLVAEDSVAGAARGTSGPGRGLEVRRDAEPEVAPVVARCACAP